jgi:hypothetical protein
MRGRVAVSSNADPVSSEIRRSGRIPGAAQACSDVGAGSTHCRPGTAFAQTDGCSPDPIDMGPL